MAGGVTLPSLPTCAEVEAQRRGPIGKGTSRKTAKGRKARAEKKVKDAVRKACVERDGDCALQTAFFHWRGFPFEWSDNTEAIDVYESCDGPSEWAHMHVRRRSKTRGMAPEERHDTKYSLMLCKTHHEDYDAKRLIITALTRKGADGPLKFRRKLG